MSWNRRPPSIRSVATTNTASDSIQIRRSTRSEQGGCEGECQADGVLLKGLATQPLTKIPCGSDQAEWCRIAGHDMRRIECGKTNRYDKSEWIRLCASHTEEYGEWVAAQQCIVHGCCKERSEMVVDGALAKVCKQHMAETKVVGVVETEQKGEQECKKEVKPEHEEKGEIAALSRVMKLQKRAMRSKTPRNRKKPDSEEEIADTGSQSRGSAPSRVSPNSADGRGSGTQLTPPRPETNKIGKEEPRMRRRSAGSAIESRPMDMLPFELVKRRIRPIMVPLSSQCLDLPVCINRERIDGEQIGCIGGT